MWRSYSDEGVPIRFQFARLISKDGIGLAISDLAMVLSCFMAVGIQKTILTFRLNRKIGYTLQHVWQAVFLGVAIYWVFYKDWPWVRVDTSSRKIHKFIVQSILIGPIGLFCTPCNYHADENA